ncbi:putative plant self-incompatibility S1 [Lupinus albus]|uniref:S-protein homolog n=1 Tax=Lupinus albus TaxID=3870 RepID=A0A6A4NMH9_LUPAL|nr:putative plant self-incompatibility S1 [Lupinus albus]
MAKSSTHIFLFSLISIAAFMAVSDGWLGKYTHIYIKNGLDKGTPLTVHCKSKDDDLGVHVLKYDEEYKFQFEPNFFQNTLFFCGFTWDSKLHKFDIYNQGVHENMCKPDCKWSITRDHPCMFNFETKKYDICRDQYY